MRGEQLHSVVVVVGSIMPADGADEGTVDDIDDGVDEDIDEGAVDGVADGVDDCIDIDPTSSSCCRCRSCTSATPRYGSYTSSSSDTDAVSFTTRLCLCT